MREHFDALNTLAGQFDGLPKIAYISHLVEKFGITELQAAALVESWLNLGRG